MERDSSCSSMYACMYVSTMYVHVAPSHAQMRFTCTVGIVLLLIAIAQLFPDFEWNLLYVVARYLTYIHTYAQKHSYQRQRRDASLHSIFKGDYRYWSHNKNNLWGRRISDILKYRHTEGNKDGWRFESVRAVEVLALGLFPVFVWSWIGCDLCLCRWMVRNALGAF